MTDSTGVYFRLKASETPLYVINPSTIFNPRLISMFVPAAFSQPLFAISTAYGNVAFVSAIVEVNGTAPGILATQ